MMFRGILGLRRSENDTIESPEECSRVLILNTVPQYHKQVNTSIGTDIVYFGMVSQSTGAELRQIKKGFLEKAKIHPRTDIFRTPMYCTST